MTGITKAVIELEKQHGPINDIPESIMKKWRAEHPEIMKDGRDPELKKHMAPGNINQFNNKISKQNTENKRWLVQHMPLGVIQDTETVMSYDPQLADFAKFLHQGYTSMNIAKKLNISLDKANKTSARLRRYQHCLLMLDGQLLKADSQKELCKLANESGIVVSLASIKNKMHARDFISQKRVVKGIFFRQTLIKKIEIVDKNNNVIKEV